MKTELKGNALIKACGYTSMRRSVGVALKQRTHTHTYNSLLYHSSLENSNEHYMTGRHNNDLFTVIRDSVVHGATQTSEILFRFIKQKG